MNMLSTAPLMHGAASYSLFTGFFMGANAILMARFDAKNAPASRESKRLSPRPLSATRWHARSPTNWLRTPAEYDLSTVGMVSSGGALFSLSLREQLKSILPEPDHPRRFRFVQSGVERQLLEIGADGWMRIAARDETCRGRSDASLRARFARSGYVAVPGHVTVGYFNDPVKTAATFPVVDGVRMSVSATSDRSRPTARSFCWGAVYQCINTGGEKVYPEEVEQALKSHPAALRRLRCRSAGRQVRRARGCGHHHS